MFSSVSLTFLGSGGEELGGLSPGSGASWATRLWRSEHKRTATSAEWFRSRSATAGMWMKDERAKRESAME
jgi:hypothetical protein